MRNLFVLVIVALAAACGGTNPGGPSDPPSPVVTPTPAPVRIVLREINFDHDKNGVGFSVSPHPDKVGTKPGTLDIWIEHDSGFKVSLFLLPGPSDWELCYWNPDHPNCIAATLARDISDNSRKQIQHPLQPGVRVYVFIRIWEGEIIRGRGQVGFTPFP